MTYDHVDVKALIQQTRLIELVPGLISDHRHKH